ncbi:AraC family transcriptional regulator [Enterococcus sp. BWR-S5]|uniref:AraC family transcriptional regulator n=1 Tax=Enterococcus sp. BWR-S5 TaxID=2787714 RepID=UPI001924421C|nr:AraC family transcriptional regulator [Enterococcus sp. BWR-S5]MBL1226670.1 AraC family transcriptional regulator [Enterococcus sp. BWR-S5]
MHAWEAVQVTVDFIEEHLEEDIAIDELAALAKLSPFYYQRLFSRLVKKPIREYIKFRRLAHATELLPNKNLRILDIAIENGFNSHETFTRAFKEAYGMTPETFRENPVMLNQFDKPDLLLNYVMVDEGVPLISDGLVLEFNKKKLDTPIPFLGFEGYVPIEGQMPNGEATGVDIPGEVWKKFHENKHAILRSKNSREIGVAYLGDAPKGSFTYFAGAEVETETDDNRFSKWLLPAREYIVCGFEAENFQELVTVALNKALKYSGLWLEKHDLTMDTYSPEIYYDSSPDGSYMEFWLPAEKKA